MPEGDTIYRVKTTVNLNVRAADGTRFAPIGQAGAGEALDVIEDGLLARAKLGREDQWIQVRTPAGQTGWTAAWLVAEVAAGGSAAGPFQVTPTVQPLNIRSGALTDLPVVTSTPPGALLDVLENASIAFHKVALGAKPPDQGQEKHWILVRTAAGLTGWVAAWFVTPDPDGPLPDPLSEEEHTPIDDEDDEESSTRDEETRVREVAFGITQTFEGGGFSTFQNHPDDRGIISFGIFQFTLQSGVLGQLVSQYIAGSDRPAAVGLRAFEARLNARDASLRTDAQLKALLLESASDPVMQELQIKFGTTRFWDAIHTLAIQPRGLKLPLTCALLFDIALNFGLGDLFVRKAEREFGAPERSRIGENGITEEALITRVAALRKISHDGQAEAEGMGGLKVRGDFWVALINAGDWQLHGNADGKIKVKSRMIQAWP